MTTVKSDLFKFITGKKVIIPHVVNNRGGWGAGFVLALSKHFPSVEADYRAWCGRDDFYMGNVLFSVPTDEVHVAHMLCQDGFYHDHLNGCALNYDALRCCLDKVNTVTKSAGFQVVAPKFGCGLAGGDWNIASRLIEYHLGSDVVICEI